jgi:protein-tyrosine phosphatase
VIDLHLHLLPGIDDGADDLDTAAAMCRQAAEDGCVTLVATPHQRTERWENLDAGLLEALRRQVEAELDGRPRVLLGGEIRVDSALLDDLSAPPGPLSLAGSRYLLLELDRQRPHGALPELVHELAVRGRVPVFAHPEFIPELAGDLDLAAELAAAGALFQVTAASVTGDFGRAARTACRAMLEAGLVHFVASDAHGRDRRPPDLHRARRRIAERWGEDLAERLTEGNPRRVLADVPLATPVAAPAGG